MAYMCWCDNCFRRYIYINFFVNLKELSFFFLEGKIVSGQNILVEIHVPDQAIRTLPVSELPPFPNRLWRRFPLPGSPERRSRKIRHSPEKTIQSFRSYLAPANSKVLRPFDLGLIPQTVIERTQYVARDFQNSVLQRRPRQKQVEILFQFQIWRAQQSRNNFQKCQKIKNKENLFNRLLPDLVHRLPFVCIPTGHQFQSLFCLLQVLICRANAKGTVTFSEPSLTFLGLFIRSGSLLLVPCGRICCFLAIYLNSSNFPLFVTCHI